MAVAVIFLCLCHRKNIFNILVGDIIVYAEEEEAFLLPEEYLQKKAKQSKIKDTRSNIISISTERYWYY